MIVKNAWKLFREKSFKEVEIENFAGFVCSAYCFEVFQKLGLGIVAVDVTEKYFSIIFKFKFSKFLEEFKIFCGKDNSLNLFRAKLECFEVEYFIQILHWISWSFVIVSAETFDRIWDGTRWLEYKQFYNEIWRILNSFVIEKFSYKLLLQTVFGMKCSIWTVVLLNSTSNSVKQVFSFQTNNMTIIIL